MEGDVHAYYSICTRERTGSVLHGSRFSRYEAFGHRIIRSKSGSIGLSEFTRLHRILLSQRQTENSAEALSVSALRFTDSGGHDRQSTRGDHQRAGPVGGSKSIFVKVRHEEHIGSDRWWGSR
jgi:hypothetical protein